MNIFVLFRYNTYGTPLSPILEERESASNSESANVTRDDSGDASIASKGGSNSLSEDDVLLIDTQTNRATLVEGVPSHSQQSQVKTKSNSNNPVKSIHSNSSQNIKLYLDLQTVIRIFTKIPILY